MTPGRPPPANLMLRLDSPVSITADRLDFDSELEFGDGFEQYREFYGIGAEILRTGPAMRARLRGWRLDRMLLYDRYLHDVGHRRDAERVVADGFDHFTLTLLLSGAMTLIRKGHRHVLQPGELMLLDTSVPNENRMDDAHVVTIAVARERLAAVTDNVAALDGLVLQSEQAQLFRDFVELLLRSLPDMSRSARMAAAGILTTLLTVAIDNAGIDRSAGSSQAAERLTRLRQVVDTQLGEVAFDVAELVRRSGMSRPTLYRLLAPHGGVAAFIRNRRLEHLRRRLADPTEARTFAVLARETGFANASDASRAFFDRYDVRPSNYRAVIGVSEGGRRMRTLQLWLDEVR